MIFSSSVRQKGKRVVLFSSKKFLKNKLLLLFTSNNFCLFFLFVGG